MAWWFYVKGREKGVPLTADPLVPSASSTAALLDVKKRTCCGVIGLKTASFLIACYVTACSILSLWYSLHLLTTSDTFRRYDNATKQYTFAMDHPDNKDSIASKLQFFTGRIELNLIIFILAVVASLVMLVGTCGSVAALLLPWLCIMPVKIAFTALVAFALIFRMSESGDAVAAFIVVIFFVIGIVTLDTYCLTRIMYLRSELSVETARRLIAAKIAQRSRLDEIQNAPSPAHEGAVVVDMRSNSPRTSVHKSSQKSTHSHGQHSTHSHHSQASQRHPVS